MCVCMKERDSVEQKILHRICLFFELNNIISIAVGFFLGKRDIIYLFYFLRLSPHLSLFNTPLGSNGGVRYASLVQRLSDTSQ